MQRFDGHPDIAHTLAHQGGLITRRQALDTGMSGALVDGLVRTGRWVPVRRGVYMPADGNPLMPTTADPARVLERRT
jgi:Transcriptional regulator, AbiEi antitoxin